MPDSFQHLSAEIDAYLARQPDDMTQAGLLRLLQRCQAAAHDTIQERDELIAALKAQLAKSED